MISSLMEFNNYLDDVRARGFVSESTWKTGIDNLLLLIAPSVPHLAEELWTRTGHKYSIHNQKWPIWSEELVQQEQVTLVIQVNGKLRDTIEVDADIDEEEAKQVALKSEKIKKWTEGKEIVKVIFVKGKLVNIVIK